MIVIVGAGPAGIAAALAVRKCGLDATVIDDNPAPGGQIWRSDSTRRQHLESAGVHVLSGARVVSIDPEAHTLLVEDTSARVIDYTKLILATGSRELFLPFPGWTLPGVFGAGGLQALVKSGLDVKGKRIVIGGTGPLLIAVAFLLRKHGANVLLIAEQTHRFSLFKFSKALLKDTTKLLQGLKFKWSLAAVPYLTDCWIEAAEGDGRLQRLDLRQGDKRWTQECDYAGIGYGLTPNDELQTIAGEHSDVITAQTGDVDFAILSGTYAGYTAAKRTDLLPDLTRAKAFKAAVRHSFALRPELLALPQPETLVCRCEDVTFASLQPYPSFRAAKLQTRCGMGPCQGRICGAAARVLFGWTDTSVRPPAFPARIGTLIAPATKEGNP